MGFIIHQHNIHYQSNWDISKLDDQISNLKREKGTIEVHWCRAGKGPSKYFSQWLKYRKWMNSCTYLCLVRFGLLYRDFGVGLLVRCHYHRGRCVDLVGRVERISGNSPMSLNSWSWCIWLLSWWEFLKFARCLSIIYKLLS